jgi:hypothetical protein
MQSAAPGKLRQKIKEKAEAAGRAYHEVDAANTTQACSACGVKSPRKIELRTRAWKCGECGTEHDRDINAARNIGNRANAKHYPETPVCNGQVARGNAPSDVRREAERSASTPVNCEEAQASTSERGVPSPTLPQNGEEHSTLYQLHMFDGCNDARNSPAKSNKKRVAKKSRTNQRL